MDHLIRFKKEPLEITKQTISTYYSSWLWCVKCLRWCNFNYHWSNSSLSVIRDRELITPENAFETGIEQEYTLINKATYILLIRNENECVKAIINEVLNNDNTAELLSQD
jgi:hypothetical protein